MFKKVNYKDLNSKQKENYNFHKVSSKLADYGFNSMRLNDDWEGADFISINKDEMIKVQLKGRFTIDKKYIGKDIFISFLEDEKVKIYKHDDALEVIPENVKVSKSWSEVGNYSWGKTPEYFNDIITLL
tara:strand:- start:464 stop:850 length:387 start_codon:yes stop_codon:yes gene_type:complete